MTLTSGLSSSLEISCLWGHLSHCDLFLVSFVHFLWKCTFKLMRTNELPIKFETVILSQDGPLYIFKGHR